MIPAPRGLIFAVSVTALCAVVTGCPKPAPLGGGHEGGTGDGTGGAAGGGTGGGAGGGGPERSRTYTVPDGHMRPCFFTADGQTALIMAPVEYSSSTNYLYVLDISTGIPETLPSPKSMPGNAAGDGILLSNTEMYVLEGGLGNPSSGALHRYNWTSEATNTVLSAKPALTRGAFHPATGFAYMTTKGFSNATLLKVATTTDTVMDEVATPDLSYSDVHVNADGSKIYVENDQALDIYGTSNLALLGAVALAVGSSCASSADGTSIACPVPGTEIEVVDTNSDAKIGSIARDPGIAPAMPAFHPDGTKLFLATGEVIDFQTGELVKDLGHSGTRVFVNYSGSVVMIADHVNDQVHLVETGL